MVTVREIQEADFPQVMQLAKRLHQESPYYREYQFSEDRTSQVFESFLDDPTTKAWVAEIDGVIVGYFGGYIAQESFFNDLVARDYSMYVMPEIRSTRRGAVALLEMAKRFVEWAKLYSQFAQLPMHLRLGIDTMLREKSFDRFMARLGFKPLGTFYYAEKL